MKIILKLVALKKLKYSWHYIYKLIFKIYFIFIASFAFLLGNDIHTVKS